MCCHEALVLETCHICTADCFGQFLSKYASQELVCACGPGNRVEHSCPISLHQIGHQNCPYTNCTYFIRFLYLVSVVHGFFPPSSNTSKIILAIASSYPHTSAAQIFRSICWTWLHLLQFCVANQLNSISEDTINKPWRLLPSNIVSWIAARHLRWTLLPLCLLLSLTQGTLDTSCVLSVATYVHNDMEFGERWLNRNLLCAIGYWAFNRGAAVIAYSGMYFRLLIMCFECFVKVNWNCALLCNRLELLRAPGLAQRGCPP